MTELDLTEAIEAAAIAWRCHNRPELEHASPEVRRTVSLHLAEHPALIAAVRAAAPIIERAVREREARRLIAEGRAHGSRWGQTWDTGFVAGMERAAHSLANEADREASGA